MNNQLQEYEILAEYECLHNGWEMDNEGFVAIRKSDSVLVLLESDHGRFQEYSGDDAVKKLTDWIQMYSNTVRSVKEAMRTFIEESRNKKD